MTAARLGYRPELDGVRALAVAAVVLQHVFPAVAGGHVGVEMFFVLSGFLIGTLLYEEHDSTGRISLRGFYKRRLLRLGPALVITVIGASVLGRLFPLPHADAVWRTAMHVLLDVSNFVTAREPDATGYLVHAWSLAVEEQFYLAFPVLLVVAARFSLRASTVAWWALALAAVSTLLRVVIRLRESDPIAYFDTETRVAAILVGVALAAVRQINTKPSALATPWSAYAGLVGIAAAVACGSSDGDRGLLLGLPLAEMGTALLLVGLMDRAGLVAGVFRAPILLWLGRRSYALYLYHFPLVRWQHEFAPSASIVMRVTIGIVLPVLLAAASHPLEQRFTARRRTASVGAVIPAQGRTDGDAAAPLSAESRKR